MELEAPSSSTCVAIIVVWGGKNQWKIYTHPPTMAAIRDFITSYYLFTYYHLYNAYNTPIMDEQVYV